jgi:hypothetical protein
MVALCISGYIPLTTVKKLGEILPLPLYGPGAVPDRFDAKTFWLAITGRTDYVQKGAKAFGIQNLCFHYAQKVLAFALFGRGDSTCVATQREIFFLFARENRVVVSIAAFAADYQFGLKFCIIWIFDDKVMGT